MIYGGGMMIYDIYTKNKSFINFARVLKNKGVKNYANHLILYDESLVGVDPFSPYLTQDQKARILAELSINPWYYFREVTRFDDGTKEGTFFDCHIGSYMLVWSHIKNINTFTVLPRQVGKTTTHLAWFAWLMMFGVENQFIVFSLQEHTAKKTILTKWRWYIDSLPEWIKLLVTSYNDQNSTEEKSLAKTKNKILCFGGAVNEEGADRSARSFTSGNILMDEVGFFKFNQDFFNAASQATNTAMLNARRNRTHYGIHMTTTPNRRDEGSREGYWAYNYFNCAAPFRYEILDFTAAELKNYLTYNAYDGSKPNGFLRLEFTWKECGKPQEWYDNAILMIGDNIKKIKQELELVWPLSDSGSPFSEKELTILESFSKKPIVQSLKFCDGRFYLDFYEQINPLATYIISIDTASGYGLDGTAVNVIDPIDHHICGSMNYNKIGAVELEEIILTLMRTWFRDAFLVIEAAPIAIPILQRLASMGDIESRLFKALVIRQAEKKLDDGTVKLEKIKVWRYGVSTNTETRPQMMDLLMTIVRDTPHVLSSSLVFNDVRNLVYKNGKIEASERKHDDSIMSYLIARWAIVYSPWFKSKKFIGGFLTRDLLTQGSKSYAGIESQTNSFGNILSMENVTGVVRSGNKGISSTSYADEAERKEKNKSKDDKNKARFSIFLGEGF
jgi:hypothetical protein